MALNFKNLKVYRKYKNILFNTLGTLNKKIHFIIFRVNDR
jgi:hypothetical protein